MQQTLYVITEEKIEFTAEHLQELQDAVLDCYNQEIYYNPVIYYLRKISGYPRRDINDVFNFYFGVGRWSFMPFANVLKNSNIDRNVWIELYRLYESDKYKRRKTKLKKMFNIIAGIKLD